MSHPISVALCADKNVEVGLHVTLYSLLNSSEHSIDINLVQKGYSATDIDRLHQTLSPFVGKYVLNAVSFDEKPLFGNFKGMHGSQFNFTKLMLAHIFSDDRIIYLDSDLIINRDLGDLYHTDLQGMTIGAAGVETIGSSLRSSFYQSIGMKSAARYFNSGVMLMDLKQWRDLDITHQCLAFANKYVDRVAFGDEAILNCIFYENNFHVLEKSYNHALYTTSPQISLDERDKIFHFVGSPKP